MIFMMFALPDLAEGSSLLIIGVEVELLTMSASSGEPLILANASRRCGRGRQSSKVWLGSVEVQRAIQDELQHFMIRHSFTSRQSDDVVVSLQS